MVMLMPAIQELKPLERKVLEVVREAGNEWLTRGQISKLLNRPGGIQPNDIAAIERLTMMGLIEARETTVGVAKVRWEYRAQLTE